MIRIVLMAMLVAAGARAAEDFTPVKAAESVTYPLPPVPMPAVRVSDATWTDTEDGPAIRVSRAWDKLGHAAGVERHEAAAKIYQAGQSEATLGGTDTLIA